MALNSLDIQNKTFKLRRGLSGGYDQREVDEFLEIIVSDYDEMSQKIKDNEQELKSLRERLKDFDNMKDSLNRSIIVAQETAENVKNQAEADANRVSLEAQQRSDVVLEAAQREARQILQTTYDEARRLVNESDELKRGMRSYHQRISMLIEGQLATIKSVEWEETLKPSPVYVGDSEEKLREIIERTNQAFMPIDEQGHELVVDQSQTEPETLASFEEGLSSPADPVAQAQEAAQAAQQAAQAAQISAHEQMPSETGVSFGSGIEEDDGPQVEFPTDTAAGKDLNKDAMHLGGKVDFGN